MTVRCPALVVNEGGVFGSSCECKGIDGPDMLPLGNGFGVISDAGAVYIWEGPSNGVDSSCSAPGVGSWDGAAPRGPRTELGSGSGRRGNRGRNVGPGI
jgi:hypothetical protein